MKILYAGYRDHNHSKYGGYDYIRYYPEAVYLDAATLPLGHIPAGKRGKRLNLMVLDYFARKEKNFFDIIHFFYGDVCLFKPKPKESFAKFISTIHLKSEILSKSKLNILKSHDGVIALSTSETDRLKELGVNSYFIPHGFPMPLFEKKVCDNLDVNFINVFYSGMNYRDFDTFYKIARYCLEKKLFIRFYAVGQSPYNKEKLKGLSNVVICPRLEDDAYYSLLSQCDYNFLPLTFATANNALLEAQALGIISIIPKITGITDYAECEHNLFYSSYDDIVALFDNLSKSVINNNLSEFSKSFLWENIYSQLKRVYEDVLRNSK